METVSGALEPAHEETTEQVFSHARSRMSVVNAKGSVYVRCRRRSSPCISGTEVHRNGLQLFDLLLRQRIGGEHAGADLAAREIFQPARHPIRRIELRVQMRLGMILAVRG